MNKSRIIGYRKNGCPIYLIAGGAPTAVELTHSQAVTRLKDIHDEVERIRNKETLTPEDESRFAELTAEFKTVDEHRKALEREAAYEEVRTTVQEGLNGSAPADMRLERGGNGSGYDRDAILEPDSIEEMRFRSPWDLSEMRTYARSQDDVGMELRSRAFAAIEKMQGANDKVREAATHILDRFDDKKSTIARFVLAASAPAYVRAFSKRATNPTAALSQDEERALENVRAMSLTDSAGGYLVPFQLDPTLIITANGSQNDVRQIARKVVATGDTWNGVSSGAAAWSWDAEASEVSDDATTFANPNIPVYKAAGFVPISIEALQDEANVGAAVAEVLSFGRDVLEAAAFITGSGSGQPTGIITALTGVSASIVTSATADTLAAADIYSTFGSLPSRYRRNAAWLANVLIFNRIRQFDTAGGSSFWANLGQDTPERLLGKPVYEAEDMDGTITAAAENYVAVFGDWNNYVIADRLGMTVDFIPHLFGTNRRPTGQSGWYAYYRVGADSVNDAAFRMLNVT